MTDALKVRARRRVSTLGERSDVIDLYGRRVSAARPAIDTEWVVAQDCTTELGPTGASNASRSLVSFLAGLASMRGAHPALDDFLASIMRADPEHSQRFLFLLRRAILFLARRRASARYLPRSPSFGVSGNRSSRSPASILFLLDFRKMIPFVRDNAR